MLAGLVLYAHCYAITGSPFRDQLFRVTRGDMTFGRMAVLGFFVLSGFLVTQSLSVSQGPNRLLRYVRNRALRVWPALVVATLLLAFVVGAMLTKRSLDEYFAFQGGWSPWWYTTDTLTYNILSNVFGWHTRIRDVFAGNPMNAVANSSLWSLRFEIALYVVLGLGAFLFRYRIRRLALSGLLVVAALYLAHRTLGFVPPVPRFWVLGNYGIFIELAVYFFLGSAMYVLRDRIPYWPLGVGVLAIVAILGSVTSLDIVLAPLAIAYGVICIGVASQAAGYDARFGDYSYGTYIYAWPVQQTLVTLFQIQSPYLLFVTALPITIGLAFLSWRLVEGPALRLKRRNSTPTAAPAIEAAVPSPAIAGPDPVRTGESTTG